MRARLLPILCLLCLCGLAAAASAQESPEYARATELGIGEFEQRNFEEARAHFLKAHALFPNARTLRALGMVEFELKNYVDSVRYLEDALASSVKSLEKARRNETETLLETANAYVARYRLRISAGTSVLLDGRSVESPGELVLAIGEHQLEFRAPAHIPQRRSLKIKGGEREQLTIALVPITENSRGARAPFAPPVDADERSKKPVYKNPWLWTAVGVLVAGATAGALVAVYGRRDGGTSVEEPYMGSGGAPPLMPPP